MALLPSVPPSPLASYHLSLCAVDGSQMWQPRLPFFLLHPDVLFLKHECSILRQSSNPVCGFAMMEQVRLCAVWPTENWLGLNDCLRMLQSCFRKRTSASISNRGKRPTLMIATAAASLAVVFACSQRMYGGRGRARAAISHSLAACRNFPPRGSFSCCCVLHPMSRFPCSCLPSATSETIALYRYQTYFMSGQGCVLEAHVRAHAT